MSGRASRRVSLPSADDLFRPTDAAESAPAPVRAVPDAAEPTPTKRPSGRVRHDEKMTVYVTSAELLELEQARLSMRARHGLAIDRGRLVREAISLVLADYEEHGEESALVRRLIEG
ncbi:MAG: hypothetical protein V9G04_08040 [Nocardioides sp.]|jgi:hypothetical protein